MTTLRALRALMTVLDDYDINLSLSSGPFKYYYDRFTLVRTQYDVHDCDVASHYVNSSARLFDLHQSL